MNMNMYFHFPEMAFFSQQLCDSAIEDVPAAVAGGIDCLPAHRMGNTGDSVAVAVGSRKIDKIDTVVARTVKSLQDRRLKPFIVPAMGSHGGATPEGQRAVLAGFNITEASMGVPIRAEMDTVRMGTLDDGMPVHFSAAAVSADHIVVINRIKPHTKFSAEIESGLCKMLAIGLGKADGAAACHRHAVRHSFSVIETLAGYLLERVSVLFGIGLIEDGYGRLSKVLPVLPEDWIDAEKAGLKAAAAMMGKIPFDLLDLLIVDYIGKDISGIGMDSNVTGRHRDIVGDFHAAPNPKRIFVRDLTPASDGNANGIGLADITTRRLVERIDRRKTAINAITAISPEKGAIPLYFDTDRECFAACFHSAGLTDGADARIVRIRNTADLKFLQISRPLKAEAAENIGLTRITPWQTIEFDAHDNLREFYLDD